MIVILFLTVESFTKMLPVDPTGLWLIGLCLSPWRPITRSPAEQDAMDRLPTAGCITPSNVLSQPYLLLLIQFFSLSLSLIHSFICSFIHLFIHSFTIDSTPFPFGVHCTTNSIILLPFENVFFYFFFFYFFLIFFLATM